MCAKSMLRLPRSSVWTIPAIRPHKESDKPGQGLRHGAVAPALTEYSRCCGDGGGTRGSRCSCLRADWEPCALVPARGPLPSAARLAKKISPRIIFSDKSSLASCGNRPPHHLGCRKRPPGSPSRAWGRRRGIARRGGSKMGFIALLATVVPTQRRRHLQPRRAAVAFYAMSQRCGASSDRFGAHTHAAVLAAACAPASMPGGATASVLPIWDIRCLGGFVLPSLAAGSPVVLRSRSDDRATMILMMADHGDRLEELHVDAATVAAVARDWPRRRRGTPQIYAARRQEDGLRGPHGRVDDARVPCRSSRRCCHGAGWHSGRDCRRIPGSSVPGRR